MSFTHDLDIVYRTYINLDVKEIDKYIYSIFEQYGINNKEYVMNSICEYSSNLGKEEYQKYRQKLKEVRDYYKEITQLMNEYLENDSPQTIFNLLKCNDIDSLSIFFESYIKKKPKRKIDVDYLKDVLKETNKKLNRFDMYKEYLESDQLEQNVANLIALLFCEDEKKAINLLKEYHPSKSEYETSLNKFENLFPSQKYNLEYLKSLFNKYFSSYAQKLNDPVIKKNIELIKDMVASNYSILEYLSYNGGYNIGEINSIFSEVRNLNIPEYKDMLTLLSNRSDKNLFKYLNDLVLKIYESEHFELMDYYNYTKLSIQFFKKYVLENVSDDYIKKDVLHKLSLIWDFSREHIELSENSINGVTIIKGVTIDIPEKKKIYHYLKDNGIPVVDVTLKHYVRKYAIGELNLESFTKKKI